MGSLIVILSIGAIGLIVSSDDKTVKIVTIAFLIE